jgi:hypothetical protein
VQIKFNNPGKYLQQIEGFVGIMRVKVGAQWVTGFSSMTFRAYGPYGGQWRRDIFANVALER